MTFSFEVNFSSGKQSQSEEKHFDNERIGAARRISSCFSLIAVASKYGGVVYGGFARQVIVPIEYSSECEIKTFESKPISSYDTLLSNPKILESNINHINIWFDTQDDIDGFLGEMGYLLEFDPDMQTGRNPYGFEIKRMKFYIHSRYAEWVEVDLVKSETIPVNDFDVNRVFFKIVEGKWIPDCLLDGQDVSKLCLDILDKEASMLPEYLEYIATTPISIWQQQFEGIYRKYIQDGWRLRVNGNRITRNTNSLQFCYMMDELCHKALDCRIASQASPATGTESSTSSSSNKTEVPNELSQKDSIKPGGELTIEESAKRISFCFDLIKKASKYGGKVLGGFVRRVIVPLTCHVGSASDPYRIFQSNTVDQYEVILTKLEEPLNFRSVKIWFKSGAMMKAFLRTMVGKVEVIGQSNSAIYRDGPDTTRAEFYLNDDKSDWINVNLLKSERIPSSKVDVNSLTFKISGGSWSARSYYMNKSPTELISSILTKVATMLPSYREYLSACDTSMIETCLNKCFKDGWTLRIDGGCFPPQRKHEAYLKLKRLNPSSRAECPIGAIASPSNVTKPSPLKETSDACNESSSSSKSSSKAEDLSNKELTCPCCQQKVLLPNKPLKGLIDVEKLIQFMWNSSVNTP